MEDRNVFTAGVLHAVLPIPMQRIARVLFRSVTMRRCSEARQQVQTCPGVNFTGRGRASLYPRRDVHIWSNQLFAFLRSEHGRDGCRAMNTVGERRG